MLMHAIAHGVVGTHVRESALKVDSGIFWPDRTTTVVLVAFSSLARILGECSTINSPHALFFFF